MYGAAPYVAEEYDIDNTLARKILVYWMRTFSLRHPKGRQEDPMANQNQSEKQKA